MKRVLIFTLYISGILQVHALVISEIMFDPLGADTGREWVEVYNDSAGSVDISAWKLFEGGTNHGLVPYSGGATIAAGGYAVVADNPVKFLTDHATYTGILYDSAFSLSNTGEQLILKDGSLTAKDTVTYDALLGGTDDGTTLSLISGAWVRGIETPGASNQASTNILTTASTTVVVATTSNQATVQQVSPPSPDIVLYMPFEKIAVAGAETEFVTYGMTRAGKSIDNLTCTWAFGDGGQATGTSTKYRYAYAGRYIAQVEGSNSSVYGTGRMVVQVVAPDVIISGVFSGKYGTYVDILNPHAYNLDLSQWKLAIGEREFSFPKNTLLLGGGVTHFSGAAMGFASTTAASGTVVRLLFPTREEITQYVIPEVEGIVLGTTTEKVVVKNMPPSIMVKKKVITLKRVATTTIAVTATSTGGVVLPVARKDTRIVSFLKTLFPR